MFILNAELIPATTLELSAAIEESLRKWILLPADANPVQCQGQLPTLNTLKIDVSNGLISSTNSLPFEQPSGTSRPGPKVASFIIAGHPILLAGTPLQLDLSANRASFSYSKAANGKLITALAEAHEGLLMISADHADLEAAILKLARQYAGDSVTIQKIDIVLTPITSTELNALLTITAKKFVTALIRITGKLKINDQLTATASNLQASSDGMVGNIAVGLLQPQLQKIEGVPLPLMAFSLGNVKLRGVEVRTTDGVEITARFGSSAL